MRREEYCRVLIVGSGGNAISTAVYLHKAGIVDFTMVSKSGGFGGAWYENRYPGLEVDMPCRMYQFSYAPNPDWTSTFVKQDEILRYMTRVASDYRLDERAHFHTEMTEARWMEQEGLWKVSTTQGTYWTKFLVVATGFLDEVRMPDIPGMQAFEGRIFHSSRWPEGYAGKGETVAVVGSGASAIQVVPELQKQAKQVLSFQRTPTWVLPKENRRIPSWEKWLLRRSQLLCRALYELACLRSDWDEATITPEQKMEWCRDFLHAEVTDPELRRILTPTHLFGCKRPPRSDVYYRSLTQPNVTVIPEGVESIGRNSVVSTSGNAFAVDAIVLTTGYYWGDTILKRIVRRDGLSVAEVQKGRPRAYKSVSVAGCPNLFLSGGAGPNSQKISGLISGETAARYVVASIRYIEANGLGGLEVREEAETEWKRAADVILDNGPTVRGGCFNYSQDSSGHDKAAWPGSMRSMWRALGELDVTAYAVVPAPTACAAAGRARRAANRRTD